MCSGLIGLISGHNYHAVVAKQETKESKEVREVTTHNIIICIRCGDWIQTLDKEKVPHGQEEEPTVG